MQIFTREWLQAHHIIITFYGCKLHIMLSSQKMEDGERVSEVSSACTFKVSVGFILLNSYRHEKWDSCRRILSSWCSESSLSTLLIMMIILTPKDQLRNHSCDYSFLHHKSSVTNPIICSCRITHQSECIHPHRICEFQKEKIQNCFINKWHHEGTSGRQDLMIIFKLLNFSLFY